VALGADRPRWVGVAGKALAGLLVAAVVLGAVEGIARLGGVGPAWQAEPMGWRSPPNQKNHRMQGLQEPHDFRVTTNRDGLRTRHPRDKPQGLMRVAVMGDSTVFGWGVDGQDSLPERLEAPLHQRLGQGRRLEVLNAAQPGYSSAQLGWLWDEVINGYAPDAVVFVPPNHDLSPALLSDEETVRGARGVAASIRVGLSRHSRIYHLLLNGVGGVPRPGEAGGHGAREALVAQRVSTGEREATLARILADQRVRGGTLSLALIPFYRDLELPAAPPESFDSGTDAGRVQMHRATAERLGITLLDVRGCCGPNAEALTFDFDRGHLNADGNERVAQALAPLVAEWLAAEPPAVGRQP
jgi:lysophospholipase L1-like esterase